EWPGYVAGLGVVDADLARMLAVDGRWEWVMAAIDAAVEQERTAGDRAAETTTDTAGDLVDIDAGAADRAVSEDAKVPDDVVVGADSVRPATACEDATAAVPADPVPQPARPRTAAGRTAGGRTAAGRAVAAVGSCAGSGVWDDPESPGALRYEWSAGLARWIRARDGTCRFPGCVVAAARCDIDHCERYDHRRPRAGGRTIRSNGACLCRRHHRLKTAGENGGNGWRVRRLGDGRLEWRTPTGELIATEPTGAGFLWPTTEIGEVCPKPVVVPESTDKGGWVVCSDPTLLQEMNRTGITVEEQLRFMLEVAGVRVHRKRVQPQPPTPAEDPPDPDEPPPF
ncbi:HNH endonuclease signature motif containing protein, partial [Antrihabitans sp. YC2-6]|uniref:HNH endonuclease signature motif containing protein n=1 Tax=Antrihabitans sp. YC2-6 TaxID=2799498 RepID=UPI0018F6D113